MRIFWKMVESHPRIFGIILGTTAYPILITLLR